MVPRSTGQTARRRPWADDADELFEPEPAKRALTPDRNTPYHARPDLAVPPPRARTLPRKTARSPGKTAWLWALVGFVCGAAFWHLIGFWGFVSSILLPPAPLLKSEGGSPAKTQVSASSSQLPMRPAKPRLAKGSPGWDATVGPREADVPPSPPRLTSASD